MPTLILCTLKSMNWEKETGLILKTALFKDATILSIWAWIYPQQINVGKGYAPWCWGNLIVYSMIWKN